MNDLLYLWMRLDVPSQMNKYNGKKTKWYLPLILLPMNTRKLDVFNSMNEEMKKKYDGEVLSMHCSTCHQMEERKNYWAFKRSGISIYVCVFDSQWYRPEYNHGTKDEANSEKHRVWICEDSLVRVTCTWDSVICRRMDRCTLKENSSFFTTPSGKCTIRSVQSQEDFQSQVYKFPFARAFDWGSQKTTIFF